MPNLSPLTIKPSHSYELLLACTQSERDDQKIEYCAREIEDWDDLLHLAYLHGIYPLVAKALKTITSVPEPVKITLKQKNTQIAQRNMVMSSELLRIITLLEADGIAVLAIKGPVLSQQIYGDIAQRQYADLDVLVPIEDMYRSLELLVKHGYRTAYPIAFLNNPSLLKSAKNFNAENRALGIDIEFHWQLFMDRQIKTTKTNVFGSLETHCTINAHSLKTLETQTQLLYLLLHGSKHFWERLEWVVDIDRFVRLNPRLDWKLLAQTAKEMEIETMFYFGLSVAVEFFATPLPVFIQNRLMSKKIERIKAFAVKKLIANGIGNHKSLRTTMEDLLQTGRMQDSIALQLRYYWLTLFQIKELDIYMVNLPSYLSPLYHIIRYYRIVKYYLFKN